MIDLLKKDRLQTFWVIFHFALGVVVTYLPIFLIVWVYFLLGSVFYSLFTKGNQKGIIQYILAYYIGIEVLGRAVKASPFIPYESGKYVMFVFLLIGIFLSRPSQKKNTVGWLVLLLSVPSLFVIQSTFTYKDIVFNYLGLLNLALAMIYFMKVRIWTEDATKVFRLCVYSTIPILVSITLKTPDFSDLEFTLGANRETSGGFGSNQVATILGVSFTILGFCYITGRKIFHRNYITLGLFFFFFFRALLTFSRGGVLGGIIILFTVFVLTRFYPIRNSGISFSFAKVLTVFVVLFFIAVYANTLTNNVLLLRYQGETASTLAGRREKDISLVTSGRYDIFFSDLEIWSNNFILGVGPGMSAYLRDEFASDKVASHVELSRLLAEHGLMGLLISLIVLIFPFIDFFKATGNYEKLFKFCLYGFAIFTSFHSAMRTNVTPFLYGLASASLIYGSKAQWIRYFIHRKLAHQTRVQSHHDRSVVSPVKGTV